MARTWSTDSVSKTLLRRISKGIYITLSWYAAIVLGITSWYLAHYNDTPQYPQARLVYTVIIAGLACACAPVFACFWAGMRWTSIVNLFFAIAFFAAFGATMEWDCDENWAGWEAEVGESYKACWKTVEAFTFISGFFWLVCALLAFGTPYCKETETERQKRLSTGSETV